MGFEASPDAGAMAALLLRATLLMAAAWAAAAALRKAGASAAARHIAWLLGIAGLLALPVLWLVVPAMTLPILPEEAAAAPAATVSSQIIAGPLSSETPAGSLVLALVYAAGAAALMLRLIAGRRTLKRLWSDSRTVQDPAWETLLSELAAGMTLSRRVELRISRGPAVPMTWGTLAPKLLFPAEAYEWPLERRRLVLLHELAHVARFDSLSRSLASLACALYWFHPGAWFAARRMRIEQEHAADDHVLMSGGSAQAYALSLLHLARGAGAKAQFEHAAAMAATHHLERRLVSIIGPARRDRPGNLFLSTSALLAGLTTLVMAAGVPVSATPTALGVFREERAEAVAPLRADVSASRGETISPVPATSGTVAGRLGDDSLFAAEPREGMPAAGASEIADRRNSNVSGSKIPGEAGRGDGPQVSAEAQQLRNYDWALPRSDPQVQTGARLASSGADRITSPTPLYPASDERTGSPKWARNVPRLARGRPPTGSPPSSQGPVVLSWSLGGK